MAIRGFIRDHFTGGVPGWVKVIYPDGDRDEDDRSKWETLGEADHSLASAAERSELRTALESFMAGRDRLDRKALRLLAHGEGDDSIAARTGRTTAQIESLREELRLALGVDSDFEITVAEAERRFNIPLKTLYKSISAGKLTGRKRDGQWLLRESDVRGLARLMESLREASCS